MRSLIVIAAAVAFLGACSDTPPASSPTPGSTAVGSAAPGEQPGGDPSAGPSGVPGAPGTGSDKSACAAITGKLSEWGQAFANAAAGLSSANGDQAKVDAVVREVKAANTKFAGELKTEASKTGDAQVKKVANDLAAALEKINGQLDPKKVAQDPNVLLAAFDLPDYAMAADAYEKVCAG